MCLYPFARDLVPPGPRAAAPQIRRTHHHSKTAQNGRIEELLTAGSPKTPTTHLLPGDHPMIVALGARGWGQSRRGNRREENPTEEKYSKMCNRQSRNRWICKSKLL